MSEIKEKYPATSDSITYPPFEGHLKQTMNRNQPFQKPSKTTYLGNNQLNNPSSARQSSTQYVGTYQQNMLQPVDDNFQRLDLGAEKNHSLDAQSHYNNAENNVSGGLDKTYSQEIHREDTNSPVFYPDEDFQ